MKNLRIWWKLVALFALGAIASCFYVTRSRAFTLIEFQELPAVQLVASQSAAVKVSNISADELDVTITVFGPKGGILKQRTETLPSGHTSTLMVTAGEGGLTFRSTVGLTNAQAAISDVNVFDRTTGQVTTALISILPPS